MIRIGKKLDQVVDDDNVEVFIDVKGANDIGIFGIKLDFRLRRDSDVFDRDDLSEKVKKNFEELYIQALQQAESIASRLVGTYYAKKTNDGSNKGNRVDVNYQGSSNDNKEGQNIEHNTGCGCDGGCGDECSCQSINKNVADNNIDNNQADSNNGSSQTEIVDPEYQPEDSMKRFKAVIKDVLDNYGFKYKKVDSKGVRRINERFDIILYKLIEDVADKVIELYSKYQRGFIDNNNFRSKIFELTSGRLYPLLYVSKFRITKNVPVEPAVTEMLGDDIILTSDNVYDQLCDYLGATVKYVTRRKVEDEEIRLWRCHFTTDEFIERLCRVASKYHNSLAA